MSATIGSLLEQMANLNPARVRAWAGTRIAPAWSFDIPAIERACDELGIIDYAVVIGCAEYPRGTTVGMYRFVDCEHRINIRRSDSAQEASRTLWHELTHALQTERNRGVSITTRARSFDAYWNHPDEIEARASEARASTHPLVY